MNKYFILIAIITGLILFGCKEEPTEVKELQVDAVVEQMAGFGWEANQIVKTGNEIQEVTQETDFTEGTEVELPGGKKMSENAIRMFNDAQLYFEKANKMFKLTSDSLIDVDTSQNGVKKVYLYDSQTDIGTYYEVRTIFWLRPNMVYDSAEIKFLANGTIFNPFDDTLKSFHQTQIFKDTYFVQSIVGNLVITDYTPTEITGAEITQDTYYHSSRYLSHLGRFAEFNPDQSGTLREDFDYKDGKTAYNEFTYNGDFTGSFAKQYRDGTTVSGTFDMVEDDLHGEMTELIDFPAGRYLDKIEREAIVDIILPDSTFSGSFFEAIYFSSGRVDSSTILITVNETDSAKVIVLDVTKKNGAHGTLTINEYSDYSTLAGNWTTWNDYYIRISDTQFYLDGSGHVHYEVWGPNQDPQVDDPILVVDYTFSPDGSGNGIVDYKNERYNVSADESGNGTLSQDGKTKKFNLLQ